MKKREIKMVYMANLVTGIYDINVAELLQFNKYRTRLHLSIIMWCANNIFKSF